MGEAGRKEDGRGRLGNVLSGLAVAVGCVLFLGGFAWGALVYKPYTVPSDSMTPTINTGDRVLAQRISGDEVRRGDVVVFTDEVWGAMPMVKRVVGVGGDKVVCCDKQNRLQLNGKALDETYLPAASRQGTAVTSFSATVPEGELFLLGDERRTSVDSRGHLGDSTHGTVPLARVDARVDAVAWPVGGVVERPGAFADLPGGVSAPGPVKLLVTAVVVGVVLILGGAAYGPLASMAGRRKKVRA
ncbi:signal peptidase I [Streptomyces spiroverticillatus]|uniref:Signal peptidase I n=1 Tax=Streptomyces finlayi TaxID=67296 RepID=A0A918X2D0_9ACTN|nr:signal peptidase I [Streptomyces finlayi]GHA25195.1 signal peptidase I [Streptomyces spiroverticillatus]GHD05518.1 signal peptidase I [Streptomyces finlayi]